jgi:protein SCO1/2
MSALSRIIHLTLFGTALLLSACVRQPSRETGADVSAVALRHRDDAPSLYDLAESWRDHRGGTRTLSTFRGRPVVLAAVYTRCSASCPLTVIEMKRIEAATDADVALVLVSLDPETDSPARLAEFARRHELVAPRWTLLNGSEEALRDLTVSLGVRYRRLSRDEIAHSNLVTLLDGNGVVVSQRAGIAGADTLIAAAHALSR